MLVVQMNHRFDPAATPATVLGPFHIDGSPELGYGARHVRGAARARRSSSPATVRSLDGTPVGGAVLDVWQADEDGAYEAQLAGRRGPAAREVHRPRGRQLLHPHHRAQGLLDPDGRPGRRADPADRHQPLPAGARALPAQRARLPAADHPPVRGGRGVPRQRRGLRHQAGARRRLRAPRARAHAGRRHAATVPWASAHYDFVLQPAGDRCAPSSCTPPASRRRWSTGPTRARRRARCWSGVTAAPITPLDLLCASGTSYFGVPRTPYVPGVQGVGTVDGRAVWFPTSAGMAPGDGSMAELAAVAAADLVDAARRRRRRPRWRRSGCPRSRRTWR